MTWSQISAALRAFLVVAGTLIVLKDTLEAEERSSDGGVRSLRQVPPWHKTFPPNASGLLEFERFQPKHLGCSFEFCAVPRRHFNMTASKKTPHRFISGHALCLLVGAWSTFVIGLAHGRIYVGGCG